MNNTAAPILSARRLHQHQQGATLLIALLMLMSTMMLGVSAAHLTLTNEKSSRNDRDRHIAFQAAESALRDAARDLAGDRIHAAVFPALPNTCHGDGLQAGLCRSGVDTPAWPAGLVNHAVDYGRFTGHTFPHGTASLPARPPRYLIELIGLTRTSADPEIHLRYRVTALGFGAQASTQVVLQAVLDADATPPRQLSWREINHWQD